MEQKVSVFNVFAVVALIGVLILAGVLILRPPGIGAEEFAEFREKTELALPTSVVLMMAHHEHEMGEGLAAGDLEEVVEEAEEILVFMEGIDWPQAMKPSVNNAVSAIEQLVEAGDLEEAKTAFEEVENTFHEVHHELHHLMEEEHEH
jgi:soluble cytochrome b562